MERALHARAVVGVKVADALGDVVDLGTGDLFFREGNFAFHESRGGHAAKVNDDLDQFVTVVGFIHRMADVGWENA